MSPPEDVAAIVFEPVQGEGGFVVPPAEWVRGLRELATSTASSSSCDEVQSGYGRTGKMFAIEHFGVEPDLITIAKSMAAGVPISGVFGRAELMDAAPDSSIGGTFVGSPLGCVAGLAVLDEIDEQRPAGPRHRDRRAHPRRASTSGRHGIDNIGDVRGLGPMLAIEFVTDRSVSKTPAPDIATAVHEHAVQSGLLLLKAGDPRQLRPRAGLAGRDRRADRRGARDLRRGHRAGGRAPRRLATTAG